MTLSSVLVLLAAMLPSAIAAGHPSKICAESKGLLAKNPQLRVLAEAAFGAPLQYRAWSATDPCVVPTAVLKYKSQTVMISTAEPPYQAHACQATLSAHIFVREGKALTLARTVKDFTKTGENCLAGRIKPVTIAGENAFSVEGTGGGQGARAGWLQFYRFEGEGIREYKLPNLTCVWVDYRNAGLAGSDLENIQSSWRIGGRNHDKLSLDFKVARPGAKAQKLRTKWSFGPQGFTLVGGKTPDAFADGACL